MAGPVWTGSLKVGLLTVPVSLYKATEPHAVRFRRLERGTAERVRNRRVNERTGEEVPLDDLVKGFEISEDEYLVVEPDELEQATPGRSRTIDLSGFVDLAEIDPVYFDTTYYLGPRRREHTKIYHLLATALGRLNRAGLAMFSMHGREHLVAVHDSGGLLELHTMHFADEVRDPRRTVDHLPVGEPGFGGHELRAAEQLVDALTVAWDPTGYRDAQQEQVRRLIRGKLTERETELLRLSVESLGGAAGRGTGTPGKRAAATGRAAAADLSAMTRDELYRRAAELDVPRRSTMNREQLREAVAERLRRAP